MLLNREHMFVYSSSNSTGGFFMNTEKVTQSVAGEIAVIELVDGVTFAQEWLKVKEGGVCFLWQKSFMVMLVI
jgi:hypothetical protein